MKRYLPIILLTILSLALLSACASGSPQEPVRESDAVENQRDLTESAADEARAAASQFGTSVEVNNVLERIERSNDPARVVYMYTISPHTGNVIFQFTCVGKLTSTSKRLEPSQSYEIADWNRDCGDNRCDDVLEFDRVQPDGAYGSSTPGQFCFDTAGNMVEIHGESVLLLQLDRPYVFPEGETINISIDPRLQSGQIDATLEIQRQRIINYLTANPDWQPGDEIPLEVLTGKPTE